MEISNCRTGVHRLARAAIGAVMEVVYPRHCIGCGGGVEGSPYRWICAVCAMDLHTVREPSCQTCGYPYYGKVDSLTACARCEHLSHVFCEGRTLFLHRGVGRALIRELKYHGGLYLFSDIMTLAAEKPALARYVAGTEVVPVPLHPRKERERGYNQSREFADRLARRFGGRLCEALLRSRDTESQTRLTREKRLLNMKNAFAIRGEMRLDEESTYMLVDDVFTTGATLNACARVLRQRGAGRVQVLTIAHG